jgi:succinyl-diaminopimelate desuccinylase
MTATPVLLGAIDPVALTRDLIRCPSVTPAEGGALDLLERVLHDRGFRCHRLPFSEPGTPDVDNLYARIGTGGPHFCFAGHSDVVPAGERKAWSIDPFAADLVDGTIYGRGASDMKGAIAAFVSAASSLLAERPKRFGSISLLITGDEEGPSINGTDKVLKWMQANGEIPDVCVVGEPTNPLELGEMVKNGRRGSFTGFLTVLGAQGHVAYPQLADNPIPRLAKMLVAITGEPLDRGNNAFQPSNLEVTTVDVGNPTTNVIPAKATATFNIRFNTEWTPERLNGWLRAKLDSVGGAYEFKPVLNSRPFLTEPGPFTDLLLGAIESVTGKHAELSTTGGTSDARFVKNYCPVAEFGLIGQTMHKVDERARVEDILALARIYRTMLDRFFATWGKA